MTYLCLWYILYYKKLSLENEDCEYTIEEFIHLSNKESYDDEIIDSPSIQSMFS
jgi:hypothetical protein